MGALQSKRSIKDRECGLLFAWRLPVDDKIRFCAAAGVVALLATGLAATVRVRVGEGNRPIERRASLLLVPPGAEWRALEMRAVEAGPFPARTDLAADPAFRDALAAAMQTSLTPGVAYSPAWREIPDPAQTPAAVPIPQALPPLPALKPRPAVPPVAATPPVILAIGGAASIEAPAAPPPAISERTRFLLSYLPDGRVSKVIGLDAETETKNAVVVWLRQARVAGGAKDGGWIAVEVEP